MYSIQVTAHIKVQRKVIKRVQYLGTTNSFDLSGAGVLGQEE